MEGFIFPSRIEQFSLRLQVRGCGVSIRRPGPFDMDYPGHYKTQILNAIQSIDLGKVSQAIQIFKTARQHGRRIFVCGNGGTDSMASQFLSDMVKSASFNRSSRFRILALSDQTPRIGGVRDFSNDRVFVEQLKNFAEPEDVVMGICVSGDSPNVVNAIDYASWIGCRTIGITGSEGGGGDTRGGAGYPGCGHPPWQH